MMPIEQWLMPLLLVPLASAIAAWLARGYPLQEAVNHAQEYTWLTLAHAHSLGRCQSLPNRFFNLKQNSG